MERIVRSGETEIRYELTRKPVKNINLRLRRDGTISVSARRNVDIRTIDNFVRSRSEWILKGLNRLSQTAQWEKPPGKFEEGDQILLLGRILTLHIFYGTRDRVEYDGENLTLFTKAPEDSVRKSRVYEHWLNGFCTEVFNSVLGTQYRAFQEQGVPYPSLRIRSMKSRWGTCIPAKKTITLNRRLIQAPTACIEAVTTHELAHFIKPNHSKEFYAVVIAAMPDYYNRWRLLNRR